MCRSAPAPHISMTLALTVLSTTTQAPPLSSACGGMYTNTGCLYTTRASTIRAPYLSTFETQTTQARRRGGEGRSRKSGVRSHRWYITPLTNKPAKATLLPSGTDLVDYRYAAARRPL